MNRSAVLYLLMIVWRFADAQELTFDLKMSGSQLFKGKIYVYGLFTEGGKTTCRLYRLNQELVKEDSLTTVISTKAVESFLDLSSDTLHDFINIYIQEKDVPKVSILRITKSFALHAKIENVEVGRLNSSSVFSSEKYYFKDHVYTVKTESDTSGKQFYLNKYNLKSNSSNFEYNQSWQFPFDKKDIRQARIVFANEQYVLVFVWRDTQKIFSQWILKLNAVTGHLIRGTKLNEKGENTIFESGAFKFDSDKKLTLAGQKLSYSEFLALDKPGHTAQPHVTVYFITIDSTGEISQKQDFKIPVTVAAGVKKAAGFFLIRMTSLIKEQNGFVLTGDIFQKNDPECFRYVNTNFFKISFEEDNLVLQKTTIGPHPTFDIFYGANDKLDLNGKMCMDKERPGENLFFDPLTFPVKLSFKPDENLNPVWLLQKNETRKKMNTYYFIKPIKKIYQLEKISAIGKALRPSIMPLNNSNFIISADTLEGKYLLRLFKW